jgi:hypothetical protein
MQEGMAGIPLYFFGYRLADWRVRAHNPHGVTPGKRLNPGVFNVLIS